MWKKFLKTQISQFECLDAVEWELWGEMTWHSLFLTGKRSVWQEDAHRRRSPGRWCVCIRVEALAPMPPVDAPHAPSAPTGLSHLAARCGCLSWGAKGQRWVEVKIQKCMVECSVIKPMINYNIDKTFKKLCRMMGGVGWQWVNWTGITAVKQPNKLN